MLYYIILYCYIILYIIYYILYTSVAPMHKCIGFVVSSVAVSSLAASNIFFEPSSNIIFEPASNRFFERVFEHECSGWCV